MTALLRERSQQQIIEKKGTLTSSRVPETTALLRKITRTNQRS